MDPALWIAFVGTVVLMQIPPGPDSMLVMARGIGQGRKVALFTVLGMTVGAGMVQLPLIAVGVSSLVKASPLAFAEYTPNQAASGSPRRHDCQPGQSLADHLHGCVPAAIRRPARKLRHTANVVVGRNSENDRRVRVGNLRDRFW
jgi:hypothetical protein